MLSELTIPWKRKFPEFFLAEMNDFLKFLGTPEIACKSRYLNFYYKDWARKKTK